jgi:quercetin dioxygenase-like cupin family protein
VTSFRDLAAAEQLRVWEGVHGRTVVGDRITLALVELEPDAVVPEHSHEQEQVGILLAGSAVFVVGGERQEMRPGGSWRILGNVPHEVVAGPQGAVVVEAFSPVRDDWASLEPSATPSRWPASAR